MAKRRHGVHAVERQLLRDLQELTSRQFVYEDGWCGMVPFDGELTEAQTGTPISFAELTWREQADVLRSFIFWEHYPERDWDDEYTIRENIASGKSPEQWLEGTSLRRSFGLLSEGKTLPPPKEIPEITLQDLPNLGDALRTAKAERSPDKATEGCLSYRCKICGKRRRSGRNARSARGGSRSRWNVNMCI